ncbi:MAG: hypothetical protein M9953_00190 [Thermomicrobiales bacterium]|nr:hypothetical protein [Thermomicrobiales bacterium]
MMLEDAPNPQFARENWTDLCGPWRFRYDDDDRGLSERWQDTHFDESVVIIVPYPPESAMSGIDDPSFHPVVWYQRELPVIEYPATDMALIRFGAVDYQAKVWVNGVLVATHTGGSSPFTVEVPATWLAGDAPATMTLRVFDSPVDLEQPRGKQSWTEKPDAIFYKRTTGIWQPVWLETVPPVYVDYIRWNYVADVALLDWYLELSRTPTESVDLTLRIDLPDGQHLESSVPVDGRFSSGGIDLSGVESLSEVLWSPSSPTLLPTIVSTSSGDVVHGYIGLRDLRLDREGFRINGERHWMRMVLSQGYFPQSLYASPSTQAARDEVELTLALGFNGARLHQKAEDPRYLYWADKKGLLLWGEIGAAYVWSDRAIERLTNEWRELVRRDINHPSIIAWVPFNESWGIAEVAAERRQQSGVRSLYALTNAIDGTRPVIGNDGWEHVISDIYSLHDYNWNAEELRGEYAVGRSNTDIARTFHTASKSAIVGDDFDADSKPIMITEYGGVSFAPSEGDEWYGYGKVGNHEEFAAKYAEINRSLHDSEELIGVCYTQLTDTEQEINGLLYEDRSPKLPLDQLAAITRGTKA